MDRIVTSAGQTVRAAARTAVFVLEVLPTLPSKPVDWITPTPVVEQARYRTRDGEAVADLYRPGSAGPHPGMLVCLGVVPLGEDHPQVKRLGNALARAGFVALLHWSPTMRDLRLAPEDVENLAMAYAWLLDHPAVDPERSGMIGTCVGGAFALMVAADPAIRDRVRFVGAWAPYASTRDLLHDVAAATRTRDGRREPWPVDQLTRKVFVHSLTGDLPPADADRLRAACAEPGGRVDATELTPAGRAVLALLTACDEEAATRALDALPPALLARLEDMSPVRYVHDIRAPLIQIIHDRDDPVIPLGESQRLAAALADRPGAQYIVFTMFKHLDPARAHLAPLALARELARFSRAMYHLVRASTRRRG